MRKKLKTFLKKNNQNSQKLNMKLKGNHLEMLKRALRIDKLQKLQLKKVIDEVCPNEVYDPAQGETEKDSEEEKKVILRMMIKMKQ